MAKKSRPSSKPSSKSRSKPNSKTFPPLKIAKNDPLYAELTAVQKWVDAAIAHKKKTNFYGAIKLEMIPSGQALLQANDEQSKRIVVAAMRHLRHWDAYANTIEREGNKTGSAYYLEPDYEYVSARRSPFSTVLQALMRPTLPFDKSEVIEFLQWCTEAYHIGFVYPLSILKKILERFSKAKPIDADLNEAIAKFAAALRTSKDKDAMKIATSLDSLYTSAAPTPAKSSKRLPPAAPSEFGSPTVQVELKRMLGIATPKAIKGSTLLEPDRFPLPTGSPLTSEHQEWSLLLHAVVKAGQKYDKAIEKGWNSWLKSKSPSERGKLILAGAERKVHTMKFGKGDTTIPDLYHLQLATYRATNFMMRSEYQVDRNGAIELMAFMASVFSPLTNEERGVLKLIGQMEAESKKSALFEGERFVLSILRDAMIKAPLLGKSDEPVTKLTNLIGDQKRFVLIPCEPWVDTLHTDFSLLAEAEKGKWCDLIRHSLTATASRPSAKWIKSATEGIDMIGPQNLTAALNAWLPQVGKANTQLQFGRVGGGAMNEDNANALRGLLWCIPLLPSREKFARLVTTVAIAANEKIPGVGPRSTKVVNAAIYCLSELGTKEAASQLAMLKANSA